jgi:hypothetical protein
MYDFHIHLHIPDHFQWMLHNGNRQMRSIIHESSDIVLWHFGQLFLEDTFQAREDNETVVRSVIIHYAELDISTAFF